MQKRNVRVVLASERLEVRYFLKEMAEAEDRVVIVGQAENATRALALIRNLRPNVAIIDSRLPYAIGPDDVQMSYINGLDIAQTISEEIPNTRVILLNNLDEKVLSEHDLGSDAVIGFSSEIMGTNVPFTLRSLNNETLLPDTPVFANVDVKPRTPYRQKGSGIIGKAMFFGGLSIFCGWLLIITMMFAQAGVILVLVGVITLFFSLVGKLMTPLLSKISLKKRTMAEIMKIE